jgi:wyosine [tRNA(Phe)-imidazoG37] synthetase (radical SAM superfamily)
MTINGKVVIEIITITTAGAVVLATAITIAEDAADVEEAAVVATGEPTIVSIYRMLNALIALIAARKVTSPLIVPSREKITMKTQTWFPKRISKTCFNPP